MSDSPEYRIWHDMWRRCTNPKNNGYERYKCRTPPEVWRDFSVFYAELGPRPSQGHSLDRIDNSKPYGPGNCRWATQVAQCRNKVNNVMVIHAGEKKCLKAACEDAGISYSKIRQRWQKTHDARLSSDGLFDNI